MLVPGVPDKLAGKISAAASGCWQWTGPINVKGSGAGYGQTRYMGLRYLVHRLVYELVVGPIRVGLTLDHLCRNRSCVNPEHLEQVSLAENRARARKTDPSGARCCPSGHAYAGDNILWGISHGRRTRRCRRCNRERQQRSRDSRRLETGA
jgi:hypothetical protein